MNKLIYVYTRTHTPQGSLDSKTNCNEVETKQTREEAQIRKQIAGQQRYEHRSRGRRRPKRDCKEAETGKQSARTQRHEPNIARKQNHENIRKTFCKDVKTRKQTTSTQRHATILQGRINTKIAVAGRDQEENISGSEIREENKTKKTDCTEEIRREEGRLRKSKRL